MSNYVVVDTSLVAKWLLEEEDSQEARKLSDHWASTGTQPVAPRLLMYGFANVLHHKVRRGQYPIDQALNTFADLIETDIELIDVESIHTDALELATRLNQGAAYDAHYLALAEHLDWEYWTADRAFARASASVTERVRALGSR